jgi:hypothetical protein
MWQKHDIAFPTFFADVACYKYKQISFCGFACAVSQAMVPCLEPSQNHIWFWLRTFFGRIICHHCHLHIVQKRLWERPKKVLGHAEGTLG